jgi:TPR repeat protein
MLSHLASLAKSVLRPDRRRPTHETKRLSEYVRNRKELHLTDGQLDRLEAFFSITCGMTPNGQSVSLNDVVVTWAKSDPPKILSAAEFGILVDALDRWLMKGLRIPTQGSVRGSSFLEPAAATGDKDAMFLLAGKARNQQRYEAERSWLEKAAAAGHAGARNNLATMYAKGDGVPQNTSEAKRLWEEGAAAGDPYSMVNLGMLSKNCEPPDEANALFWYDKAAAAGLNDALVSKGYLLQHGRLIPRDLGSAQRCYEIAADAGNVEAMFRLGSLLLFPTGEKVIDADQTREFLQRAADDGRLKKALKLFSKAAEHGHAGAMSKIGGIYLSGIGVERNEVAGRRWLRKAAERGDSEAARYLQDLDNATGHG